MKVIVRVKATKYSKAGVVSSEQLLVEMGNIITNELLKTGVLFAFEGLYPSAAGARV